MRVAAARCLAWLCLLGSAAAFAPAHARLPGRSSAAPLDAAGPPLRSAERAWSRNARARACSARMNLFDIVDAVNPLASRTDQLKRFFRTIYDRIDTDKSNYLDQAELSAAIEKLARAVDGIPELPFSEEQVTVRASMQPASSPAAHSIRTPAHCPSLPRCRGNGALAGTWLLVTADCACRKHGWRAAPCWTVTTTGSWSLMKLGACL